METASTPYKYRHGGSDCQSDDNSSVKKHQKALCILAGCYHVRLMLMYYVGFIAFMEKPEKTWNDILAKNIQKAPPEPTLFD